ncbi:hypothetical protein [Desulfoferula mesophila]|uniref:Uncharacterized protein n=1 Tax=Desulfoferula mesophila TaxID=3058419 RepID=A0AAU9F297_9BACT|nr:hypothetical protein FAK_15080 [Desulfoferula mesophilus]
MFGKLFKREDPGKQQAAQSAGAEVKSEKPREIHAAVGRELVVTYKEDPDWVWKLKQVQRPSEQGKDIRDFRVYDASVAAGRGVAVRNFESLDAHPELVLYHGWLNKKNNDVQLSAGAAQEQRTN